MIGDNRNEDSLPPDSVDRNWFNTSIPTNKVSSGPFTKASRFNHFEFTEQGGDCAIHKLQGF